MIYITTDTHFNHTDKMHLYCGRPLDYEKRIFDEMSKLTERDVLIHLGDVCVGRDAEVHRLYIQPLKCKKWLLKGNHCVKTNTWYLNHGWDFVGNMLNLNIFNKRILFSHQPLAKSTVENYDYNIVGHFHNHLPRLLRKEYVVPDEKERNVQDMSNLSLKTKVLSLEQLDYKLISVKELISTFKD